MPWLGRRERERNDGDILDDWQRRRSIHIANDDGTLTLTFTHVFNII